MALDALLLLLGFAAFAAGLGYPLYVARLLLGLEDL